MPKPNKGSSKALAAMVKKYGAKKGKRIFFSKAAKFGKGKSPQARANSVYGKGSHRVRRKKR